MTDRDRPKPETAASKAEARALREQRLAEALRANLKRRKEQARGRAGTGGADSPPVRGGKDAGRRGDGE